MSERIDEAALDRAARRFLAIGASARERCPVYHDERERLEAYKAIIREELERPPSPPESILLVSDGEPRIVLAKSHDLYREHNGEIHHWIANVDSISPCQRYRRVPFHLSAAQLMRAHLLVNNHGYTKGDREICEAIKCLADAMEKGGAA